MKGKSLYFSQTHSAQTLGSYAEGNIAWLRHTVGAFMCNCVCKPVTSSQLNLLFSLLACAFLPYLTVPLWRTLNYTYSQCTVVQ